MNTCRIALICLSALVISLPVAPAAHAAKCAPTPWDEIGPFYRPNAPVRSSVGKGYVLSGTVRSSADCSPIQNARIEFWQTGPSGQYDDAYRATVISDKRGRYRLETAFPPGYASRPSHIHILVDVKGYEGLVTQHYPKRGSKHAAMDLVLLPEKEGDEGVKGRRDELVRPGKKRQ